MPDLPIVGQPERAVPACDDAPQVAHVKRATPVVEVSVGWERVNPNIKRLLTTLDTGGEVEVRLDLIQ